MGTQSGRDWTEGPAKWAAVAVLGGASLTGIVWSIATGPRRGATETVVVPRVQHVEPGAPDYGRGAAGEEARVSPAATGAPASAAQSSLPAKIDLNAATRAELEALPGVGPELAKRIIEFRESRGPFKSVEQLDNVKGFGPKLMEKIRPLVKVGARGT